MDERSPLSLVKTIAELEADLEELKTKQFTSQDSGMIFTAADTLTGQIEFVKDAQNRQLLNMITNSFMPEHGGPAICAPRIEIQYSNFISLETINNPRMSYVHYLILDVVIPVGELDLYYLFHRRGTNDGSYAWQTLAYTQAYNNDFDLDFKMYLNSTDSGEHTMRIERSFA